MYSSVSLNTLTLFCYYHHHPVKSFICKTGTLCLLNLHFSLHPAYVTCREKWNSHKTISKFFSWNFAGQKRMEWYNQNTERKKSAIQECFTQQSCLSRTKGEVKSFPNKIWEFITTRLTLQEMLKEVQVETKGC